MTRKLLISLAAAGFAALSLTGAAEATPPRQNGIHFSGPGYSIHIGDEFGQRPSYKRYRDSYNKRRHGKHWYKERHWKKKHRRKYCRPIFERRPVWTPYGWSVEKVKVGKRCDIYRTPRHHHGYGHTNYRWR